MNGAPLRAADAVIKVFRQQASVGRRPDPALHLLTEIKRTRPTAWWTDPACGGCTATILRSWSLNLAHDQAS